MTFWAIFLSDMASAFGISTAFVLFAMWHNRRHPLVDQHENVAADYVETKMYCPPEYHVRIVKK